MVKVVENQDRVYFRCFPWHELVTQNLADIFRVVIPNNWMTSNWKLWLVEHYITDGSNARYFGFGECPFSLFLCPNRDTARRVKAVLKKKMTDDPQGHESWAFNINEQCLSIPDIFNRLARCHSNEVFIHAEAKEANPDGTEWYTKTHGPGYISIKA